MNSEIRLCTESDLEQFTTISGEAYPMMRVITESDHAQSTDRLKDSLDDERVSAWGCWRKNELVGVMKLYDYQMNVHGVKMLAGGVGSVAVHLAHKKEHVARELMTFYLGHYAKKKAPMAVLWPFRHNFYRKMGFGLGGKVHEYRICPVTLPQTRAKDKIRYLTTDDVAQLSACYQRFAAKHTGMIDESPAGWEHQINNNHGIRLVGCVESDHISGFLTYRFKATGSENPLDNHLEVNQFIYETPEALQQLLGFLSSQRDQVNRIILTSPDESIPFLLSDVTSDANRVFSPVNHEVNTSALGVMYRVLDVEQVFSLLKTHCFGSVTLGLQLNIQDSFHSPNDHPVTLRFEDGLVTVNPNARVDTEINLNIADFSSMLMGAVSFERLLTYQLSTISNAKFAPQVDQASACSEPPLCLTSF